MIASLTFLNLSSLWGLLPLLSVPFVIHILNKKFPHLVNFPDIRLIKASVAQRSSLFRLRHIILMIIRTLALLLLLLCFLQPSWSAFGEDAELKGERAIVIFLDHSLSMNYRGAGLPPSEKALVELEKIVDTLDDKDLANLVVVDSQARLCFERVSAHHNELLAFARSLPESSATTNWDAALKVGAHQIRKSGLPTEVYFISDFQRSNWSQVDLKGLGEESRLFFVDVASKGAGNRAIKGIQLRESQVLSGTEATVDIEVANYSDTSYEDRLEVRINDRESLFYEMTIPPWNVDKVRVAVPVRGSGIHEIRVLLSPDDLPQDNGYYFSLKAREKEEVVVLTDREDNLTSSQYFLKAALNPYENNNGALLPQMVSTVNIAPMHLAGTAKMFISGVNRLGEEQASLISNFIRQGGSVVYFMDGRFDAENMKLLEKVLALELPLEVGLRQTSENIPGGRIKIRSGAFKSRYLGLFKKQARKHLADLDFYEYYQARATGSGHVLLTYSEGTPAMASANVGLGHLLMCNFSVRENGSNLASQKVFPAWIQEITRAMARESRKMARYKIGTPINDEIWVDEIRRSHFLDPQGQPLRLDTKVIKDKRLRISFTPQTAGHYSLRRQDETLYSFAVNNPEDESDLRTISLDALPERSQAETFIAQGSENYEEIKKGRQVFHWFLQVCLFLLLLEALLFKYFRRTSV